jgi:hypothetical protein
MSNISAFFAQNAVTNTTEDFIVSERFQEDGKPIAWKLKAITEDENDTLRKGATKRAKGKPGQQSSSEIDQTEYQSKLVVACVVEPNLKDAELQKSYGVLGSESLIRKMLLAGEYTNLLLKVTEINGFDKDINSLVEEAKN